MKKIISNDKGVTLMALVVTIIVMLLIVSIATYSGIQTLNSAKTNLFTTELKLMQTQVNQMYSKMKNGGTIEVYGVKYIGSGDKEKGIKGIQDIGTDLTSVSTSEEIKNQAKKALRAVGYDVDTLDEKEENINLKYFKYYSSDLIKKGLAIDGVEQELLVNVPERKVVSYKGLKISDDEIYYSLEQLSDNLYNVDYQEPSSKPTFEASIKTIEKNARWEISVYNISYSENIEKWHVKYKLKSEDEDQWHISSDLKFIVYNPGEYELLLVNGSISSDESKPVKVEAVQLKNITSVVTTNNYGDYVDYNVNLGIDGDWDKNYDDIDDWRIFYKNDKYVYLIAADYMPVSKLPETNGPNIYSYNKLNSTTAYPYSVYWPNTAEHPLTKAGALGTDISDKAAEKFMLSLYRNTYPKQVNNNTKATSALLNTTDWKFLSGGISGAEAIGSSTLEMWVASWNQLYGTSGTKATDAQLYCNNVTTNGYCIGETTSPTTMVTSLSSKTGYTTLNTLYFPHNSKKDNCSGYYIASPSALNYGDGIVKVFASGNIGLYTTYSNIEIAVRPIVAIPSNILAGKQADGVWTLSE